MTASSIFVESPGADTITWGDSGNTYTMTNSALATVAARVGARGDLGAYPRALAWRWYMETQWTSAPTADGTLDLYVGFWDNDTGPANPWAQLPATDTGYAAASAGLSKRKSLKYLGSAVVETSAVGPFSAGGVFLAPARFITPMLYNAGSVALAAAGTFPTIIRMTPIYPESQ